VPNSIAATPYPRTIAKRKCFPLTCSACRGVGSDTRRRGFRRDRGAGSSPNLSEVKDGPGCPDLDPF
jgi:hypothetical protein